MTLRFFLWRHKSSEHPKWLKTTFNVVIILNAIGKIRTSKRFLVENEPKLLRFWFYLWHWEWSQRRKWFLTFKPIMTFDVVFDVLIFVVVMKDFWRCDLCHFWCCDLFLFRRSDCFFNQFRCSDGSQIFWCSFWFSTLWFL